VPEIVTGDLEEFVEAAEEAQAGVLSGGATEAIRHRRDRFVAEMVAYMRDVRNRYFFIPPMNEEDFLSLGLRLPDTIRTQHTAVNEEVDFVLEIRGTKQVHVRFWVMGQSNTAKCQKAFGFLARSLRIAQTPPINVWSFAYGKTPKLSGVAG
jgi:hypothetical protein